MKRSRYQQFHPSKKRKGNKFKNIVCNGIFTFHHEMKLKSVNCEALSIRFTYSPSLVYIIHLGKCLLLKNKTKLFLYYVNDLAIIKTKESNKKED